MTIHLNGWGRGQTVYLHFVPPRSRRAVRTVRVGRTAGGCGHATLRLAHFWPFVPRKAGAWRLQFDVKRAYDPANRLAVTYQSLIAF